MKKEDKLCGIAFDGMHLHQSEYYNQATDCAEGREDLGEFGSSSNIAKNVMVFMLKELIGNWKQT